ncbi:MAG: hypothetical protein HW421_2246 [Ignavibacteria bacterium]|nr:hypothetical protein [Ignavibacteria bacterium]
MLRNLTNEQILPRIQFPIFGSNITLLYSFVILILFSSINLFALDSTQFSIKIGFVDNEMNLLANIIKVEKITLSFDDTLLIGKKFILSKAEYVKGKKVGEQELVKCGADTIPMVIGGDTSYYMSSDPCEKNSFHKGDSIYIIDFICDNSKSDKANLNIHYPRLHLELKINKKPNLDLYSLRDLKACGNYTGFIPLNKKIPIIAYSPPFEMEGGAKGYCILNYKPVAEWHKYYKLKHYVVFYLEIKD